MAKENINQLIKQAEACDVKAMYTLAICYRDGDGTKQDFEKFSDRLMHLRELHGFSAKIKSILSFQDRPESELKKFGMTRSDAATSPRHLQNKKKCSHCIASTIQKNRQKKHWTH